MGKTTTKHYAIGYQNAMADINAIVAIGGNMEDVMEWVKNNTNNESKEMFAHRINEFKGV